MISETSASKDILNVLLLGDVALKLEVYVNPNEVMKKTQIKHQKLLTETLFHKIHVPRVIPSNDHIIHVEKEVRPTTLGEVCTKRTRS